MITIATIEERAVQAFPHNRFHRYAYSKGATEQDRIARAEERERCINIAQEMMCKECNQCESYRMHETYCNTLMEVRKAIEKVK